MGHILTLDLIIALVQEELPLHLHESTPPCMTARLILKGPHPVGCVGTAVLL